MAETASNILNSVKEKGSELTNTISEGASSLQKSAGETYSSVQKSATDNYNSLQNKIDEFSSAASAPGGDSSFFSANGLIAKFAFLVLAIIVFLVALNLGIRIIYYFMNPSSTSVYLVDGMIDGTNLTVISQDPTQSSSKLIMRSNNQTTGLEFTWSVWLRLDGFPSAATSTVQYQPIFVKGGGTYNTTGVSAISNGPGLYFATGIVGGSSTPTNSIHIMMDTVSNSSSQQVAPSPEIIDISNIPIKKWFHVAIRCQNKYLDVYINGIVVFRTNLNNVPLQNYNNVEVCGNGGYSGKLSNLIYYNRALNIVDINGIVANGPNTTNAVPNQGNYGSDYLSTLWYPTK
jgi:hypothetical protein